MAVPSRARRHVAHRSAQNEHSERFILGLTNTGGTARGRARVALVEDGVQDGEDGAPLLPRGGAARGVPHQVHDAPLPCHPGKHLLDGAPQALVGVGCHACDARYAPFPERELRLRAAQDIRRGIAGEGALCCRRRLRDGRNGLVGDRGDAVPIKVTPSTYALRKLGCSSC